MKSVENILGYIRGQNPYFRKAVSLNTIFEIFQETNLKCSKLTSFLGNKKPEFLA
jgi:hypothetical protein